MKKKQYEVKTFGSVWHQPKSARVNKDGTLTYWYHDGQIGLALAGEWREAE